MSNERFMDMTVLSNFIFCIFVLFIQTMSGCIFEEVGISFVICLITQLDN